MWLIGVAAAALLAIVAASPFTHSNGGQAPPPPTVHRDGPDQMYCGISLQLHSGYEGHPFETFIDEIAAAGANAIYLVIPGSQENGASTQIFVDGRKVPSDARLEKVIAHARRAKLKVVLMPIVLLANPRVGEWRGKIAPADWGDWWESYTDYLIHYARLAERTEVDLFMVGSELLSTERETERWRKLIRAVRREYKGLLSYSTNWDHYQVPKFWSELDLIGMTTYYDLTKGKPPTLNRLLESWAPIRKDILAWQAKVGLPIIFTEVGWPNQVTCAQYPWDYTRSRDKPDPTAQANCFEAFFRTWINEPAVAGIFIWEWRNYPEQPVGPEDTSYVPCGKPALDVITHYFQAAQGLAPQPAAMD